MKVLQLSPEYPPEIGGVASSVHEVVRRMRASGHEVTVLTADCSAARSEASYRDEATRLPVFLSLQRGWGAVKFCPTVFLKLKNTDFDIAHAHTPRKLFAESLALYKLLARRKFPYVVSVRLINRSLPAFFGAVNDVYRKTIEQLVFANAARVVVQSRLNKRVLMSKCGLDDSRIVIIPNGVDTTVFRQPRDLGADGRQTLKSTQKTILFVGRLTSQKGLEYLLEAFARILNSVSDVRLLVVGDGPMRLRYQEMVRQLRIESQVTFVGSVPHDEIHQIYSLSDIFVLPSLSESFPNVVLEAMAMGKAVVSTKVGVIPEMLDDGETALLVSPRQTRELESAILRLLDNKRLAAELGQKARKLVEERYSWESVVALTISMYEEVLGEKPVSR